MGKEVKYVPTKSGVRLIGMSDTVRDAAVAGAERVAREASRIHPSGTYQVNPAVVVAGRENEKRMGAVVADKSERSGGWRRQSLRRGIQAARVRL